MIMRGKNRQEDTYKTSKAFDLTKKRHHYTIVNATVGVPRLMIRVWFPITANLRVSPFAK